MAYAESVVIQSDLLVGLDLNDAAGLDEVHRRLEARKQSSEWWAAYVSSLGKAWLTDDLGEGSASRDAILWRLSKARTMLLFSTRLEELAWRGYRTVGVDDLRAALAAWDNRKGNESEDDWQALIEKNPTLVGLLFIGPVVIERGKAYVGGKTLDNEGGHIVDFLLRYAVGGNAALLEIKTPRSRLVGRKYRKDAHSISAELTGAIVQVNAYRDSLLKEFNALAANSDLVAFNPTCIVLAGNYTEELDTSAKRSSFELFRQGQQGLVIITYDELFDRVRRLLDTLAGGSP